MSLDELDCYQPLFFVQFTLFASFYALTVSSSKGWVLLSADPPWCSFNLFRVKRGNPPLLHVFPVLPMKATVALVRGPFMHLCWIYWTLDNDIGEWPRYFGARDVSVRDDWLQVSSGVQAHWLQSEVFDRQTLNTLTRSCYGQSLCSVHESPWPHALIKRWHRWFFSSLCVLSYSFSATRNKEEKRSGSAFL